MPAPSSFPFALFENLPVSATHELLSTGQVALLTTRHAGIDNVLALSWHQTLPAPSPLVSCIISRGSRSFDMLVKSRQCVLNIPTREMLDTVAHVGNCTGGTIDKFAKFGIERAPAIGIDVPVLPQCHALLECRLHDDRAVNRYNLFMLEVTHIRVRRTIEAPQYVQYDGDGVFTVAGQRISRRKLFQPERLN